jgi:hypothetical protein
MKRLSVYKWVSLAMVGLIAAGLFLAAAPLVTVQAASREGPAAETEVPPAEKGERGQVRLEKVYQNLVNLHERQAGVFERAAAINKKVNNLIAKYQEKGVDTTALASALMTFNGKDSEAKTAYEKAGAALGSHAGFDANGKVTDVEQAKATLKSAAESMKAQRQTMRGAFRELTQAVRDFVKSNRPAKPVEDMPSGEDM